MHILSIEDDEMIGKAVGQGLIRAGFALDWFTDGHDAQTALVHAAYDLGRR